MVIYGIDFFERLSQQEHFTAKLVFNRSAAFFFPVTQQHRDAKAEGLSYEDDYKGNALAAMVTEGKIEVRYHSAFSPEQVADCLRLLSGEPGLRDLKSWRLTYQGRELVDWQKGPR